MMIIRYIYYNKRPDFRDIKMWKIVHLSLKQIQ